MGRDSYFSDYEPVTRSRRRSSATLWETEGTAAEEVWLPRKVEEAEEHELPLRAEEPTPPPTPPSSPVVDTSTPARLAKVKLENKTTLKHGLTLAYMGVFLYTVAVYFRPYELHPSLAWSINISYWFALFTLLTFIPYQLALEGKLSVRTREVDCVLLLAVWILVTMPRAISPGLAFSSFIGGFAKVVIMFIVMVNVMRTRSRLNGLMFLGLAIACMMSVNAFNDYRKGNFSVEGYRVGKINHGMFTDPDDSALHLVTMIPLAVGVLVGSRSRLRKAFLGFCVLLMVTGLVFTFSRGGFLGLLAVTGIMVWKFGRRNRQGWMLILVVCAVAFVALVPGHYPTRILSIFYHDLDPVGSADARQGLLFRSLYVMLTHPLLGVGFDNFPIVSIQAKVSHNAYTQIGAELGIPALILYLIMIIYPIKRLAGIEREEYEAHRHSRFYSMAIGLQASLVGYMVSSFFISVAFGWYVYYLVAYAVCLRRLYETRPGASVLDAANRELKPAA